MKKMNKKGFTLIEMLVVIAIIAVLVSIIIPTVTSATGKAAAATNAANLRSVKAAVTTAYLSGDLDVDTTGDCTTACKDIIDLPQSKKVGNDVGEVDMVITFDADKEEFTCTYASKTINDFATYAEDAAWPTSGNTGNTGNTGNEGDNT